MVIYSDTMSHHIPWTSSPIGCINCDSDTQYELWESRILFYSLIILTHLPWAHTLEFPGPTRTACHIASPNIYSLLDILHNYSPNRRGRTLTLRCTAPGCMGSCLYSCVFRMSSEQPHCSANIKQILLNHVNAYRPN